MLWFKKKKKGPPGHRTNFQKSIDQNQSFFYSWPNMSDLPFLQLVTAIFIHTIAQHKV